MHRTKTHHGRFPRVRGDVPGSLVWVTRSSRVFPACAGMFPVKPLPPEMTPCFPRVRGDVPGASAPMATARPVFPACAGMFPRVAVSAANNHRFLPRVRGDVPLMERSASLDALFSPRARGCSPNATAPGYMSHVFPACAGMFRTAEHLDDYPLRFPRVRGDVPMPYLKR